MNSAHSGFKVLKIFLLRNQHLLVKAHISIACLPVKAEMRTMTACWNEALFSAELLPKSLVQDSSFFHKKRNKGNLTHNTK